MSCDTPSHTSSVHQQPQPCRRIISRALNEVRDQAGLPQQNFNDGHNSKDVRSQRASYPNRWNKSCRRTRSENGMGRPYRGGHCQTSGRLGPKRGNFHPPSTKNKRNHVSSYDPFEHSVMQNTHSAYTSYNLPSTNTDLNKQSGNSDEKNIHCISNDRVSESIAAQNALHQCQVERGPTTKVISSNRTELHKDVLGFQDGYSTYGSQEDATVNSSSNESDVTFVSHFGSCDLGESLPDGYIPPPTTPSNLTCDDSCSRTVVFNNISCHKEIGTNFPPLPVEDSSREGGETLIQQPSCDLIIQPTTSSDEKRICRFDPRSLNFTITVPGKDSHSDEGEEASEETSSVQESLNGIDMVPEQIEAISKLLENVEKERASDNYETWKEVVEKLTRVVKKCIRGCWLEPFGSYVSGFAIGTSNINIALIPNSHINSSHKMLQEMVRPIQRDIPDCEAVCDGNQDYRNASVSFFERKTNIFCKIQILGNKNLCMTAKLLHQYGQLDTRVKTLIIAVRHWAEVCEIHDDEKGRLHPLSYVLMVIHFLQQCDPPVLPVINRQKWKEIEALQDNKQEVGYLWVEFLRYYSETFNWKDHVVSITSKELVLKASKTWGKCWIAVEEPYDEALNVAKSVVSQDVCNYIRMVFVKTYNYFLHPVSPYELYMSSDQTEDSSGNELSTETSEEDQPNFNYDFHEDNFLNGLCVPIICSECEHIGHLCDACLYDENSMLHSLPKMTPQFLLVIDEALESMYRTNSLSQIQLKNRVKLVEKLEKHLKKRLKNARVELIGSSKNGFGLKDSDVDLCFTLEGRSAESINARTMVKKIKNILLANPDFTDVMYICTSKIPIVKFIDKRSKLRCDISIYNELAVHNTRLLKTYSKIDERVKILGCAMKSLAKNACINDTAQRTLSSYSYILMVLYFLQQVEPPVIPVLQEIYDGNGEKPVKIVENEDVWFFDNIENLGSVWDGKEKNHQSVGELWVGLLEFYTTKFDFHHFISISQKSLLTELKNVSSSMLFNIQDPFIKDLNLGSRMSGDMSRRTLKALQRARILFGTPVPTAKPPSGFESFQDYLFSIMNLTDGKVSEKIECSLCGKFGHHEEKCKRHKIFPKRLWSNAPQRAAQFQRNT